MNNGETFICDDDDYELAMSHRWSKISGGYAAYSKTVNDIRHTYYFHRLAMKAEKGQYVDHINCNSLDNRKENLRICTQSQNNANQRLQTNKSNRTSQYRGVCVHSQTKTWKAQIKKNGKNQHIGLFENEDEAARAWNEKATELFGEFARLNVINQ